MLYDAVCASYALSHGKIFPTLIPSNWSPNREGWCSSWGLGGKKGDVSKMTIIAASATLLGGMLKLVPEQYPPRERLDDTGSA